MQETSSKEFENLCGVDPLVNIFKDLISYDTKASPNSKAVPSSLGQLRLSAHLVTLASELGYTASQDNKGIVTIDVEASKGFENCKKLCLLAHMDTAPDASGADIKPHLVKNYEGFGIKLSNNLVLDTKICPTLNEHIGDDIIVTDGTTLLGADDKAGISVILLLLRNLKTNSSIKHGPIKIVFSIDEEIGLSQSYLDPKQIDCDFGLTVDGTALGELDIATFNAYGATLKFNGLSVHTAVAYKTLKNSITIANEFISMLPRDELPENTYGEEGFYHVHDFNGSTESTTIKMIIRDFTDDGMQKRLDFIKSSVDFLNHKYGENTVESKIVFQYANMQNVLEKEHLIVDLLVKAYEKSGVLVIKNKVRGGTDGSSLSNKGLPTPNMFTGGLNCHGPFECLPVKAFNKAYLVLENLVTLICDIKDE